MSWLWSLLDFLEQFGHLYSIDCGLNSWAINVHGFTFESESGDQELDDRLNALFVYLSKAEAEEFKNFYYKNIVGPNILKFYRFNKRNEEEVYEKEPSYNEIAAERNGGVYQFNKDHE